MCDAMADITDDFSFAYLKEAFVATLLELARNHDGDESDNEAEDAMGGGDDPFDKYEFWRIFKATVKNLRDEMSSGKSIAAPSNAGAHEGISSSQYEEMLPLLDALRLQGAQPQLQREAASSLAGPVGVGSSRPRSLQDGSVLSPIHSFAPLEPTKNARLNQGVWEWGL
jgi:transitional endoplasmic reticulum ATPase